MGDPPMTRLKSLDDTVTQVKDQLVIHSQNFDTIDVTLSDIQIHSDSAAYSKFW